MLIWLNSKAGIKLLFIWIYGIICLFKLFVCLQFWLIYHHLHAKKKNFLFICLAKLHRMFLSKMLYLFQNYPHKLSLNRASLLAERSDMFVSAPQGRRSQWPPLEAMSSSASTCPRPPSRAIWMRSRCPSARCRGTACCSTRGGPPTTSTCPWGTEPCGWSSTWAPEPSKLWWNPPAGSSTTTSGTMCEWRATFARYVRFSGLSIQQKLFPHICSYLLLSLE